MRKLFAFVISMMLAVVSLAGCGTGSTVVSSAGVSEPAAASGDAGRTQPKTGEDETITWMTLADWEETLTPIIEKYTAETGVNVKLEPYTMNDLLEVIEVKLASGSKDYDVISVDCTMVSAYANRGYIASVDEYFTPEEKASWIPSALRAGSWQGKLYSPPMNNSSQLLWYNKDLLAEAGVTIRESSVENRLTYEELQEYAEAALDVHDPDRNKGMMGIVFQQVSRVYQMGALPNSMGEKSIGDDGYTVDGVINSDGWVNAMTWYQDLYNKGLDLRGYTSEEAGPNFRASKTVFLIGGTWTANYMGDINFGYAPVPAFKGFEDKVATPTGSWHFGINKASAKQELAAEFIKYMSLGEGNSMWLDLYNDFPSTMKAIEKIESDPTADPIMKIAVYEAANTAYPRAQTPGYSEYSSVMDATFEDIRNGADVKQSLDSAVQQINMALEKYK